MKLGKFKVESGKIVVSDPCYTDSYDLMLVAKARKGVWRATVRLDSDGRVKTLTAHTSAPEYKENRWEEAGWLGVDSGTMMIHDVKYYRDDTETVGMPVPDWMSPERARAEGKGEMFYAAACNKTYDKNGAVGGVLPHGAISSSGWGDGSYPVYVKKDKNNQVWAVEIRF